MESGMEHIKEWWWGRLIGWYGVLEIGFHTIAIPIWKFVQKVMHRLAAI